MDYTIQVDVLSAVYDLYPGLTNEQCKDLAEQIVGEWDYAFEYDMISQRGEDYCDEHGLDIGAMTDPEYETEMEEKNNIYVIEDRKIGLTD